ncbi:MAG TPA: glycosyltransferase [Candidatus Elarobacter sp.]
MSDERFPLVSILIPNYNYVKYVAQAVDSAVAQTYPNVEVVVSDNCSTDGAWELLRERYATEPRVRLYRNETNVGMAGNFDRVFELARGRYLICLSSDDFFFPVHVERLMERFARDPGLDVVYSDAYFALENGDVYTRRSLPGQFPVDYADARDELVEEFTRVCPVCYPCALFKREALLAPGIRELGADEAAGDWEVIIRLALAGARFAYVAQPGMAIRIHADQFSGDAYHRTGRNVLDFVGYVERYMDHPEFVRRMRGRESGVATLLTALVTNAATLNDGSSPFDAQQHARFAAAQRRLNERARVYEPARVRESTVSVLIESAGAVRPLLRAVDSVAAQTFPNWEVVVVDHGAIPLEPILRAHRVWGRTSYVRMPTMQTPGAARNLALRMFRGEYLAVLDPDNRFAPDHLMRAVDAIERSGAPASLAAARLVVEQTDGMGSAGEPLGETAAFGGEERDVLRLVVAQTLRLDQVVFYRGLLEHVGLFNEGVGLGDDWEFLVRLARGTRFVPTGAAGVELTARIGLVVQRLGAMIGQYVSLVDAIYHAYPADPGLAAERVQHRAAVVAAIASWQQATSDPNGVAAFMAVLGGRPAPAPLAPVLQPA